VRRAMMDHFRFVEEPGGCGINTHDGSVAVLPPGADQDVRGQKADQPKPLSSLSKGHPGPRYKESDLQARDLRWVDIGSGVVSRVFPRATRLMTTSKGGPCMADIHSRRVWSLTTGRLLDECDVQNTSDDVTHRAVPHTLEVDMCRTHRSGTAGPQQSRVGPPQRARALRAEGARRI
jgi:hypothetical protein